MLRVNIATRPFYNQRGVRLWLLLAGVVLLALAALNAAMFTRLSRREVELTAQTSKEEVQAGKLRDEATRIRASIKQDELEAVLASGREANGLIDQRTFSWTALFNQLESTLPADVMLTAVKPAVHGRDVTVTLGVIGKRVDAIDEFMTRLEDSKVFHDVLSRDEQALEDGSGIEATLVGKYIPESGEESAQAGGADAVPASPASDTPVVAKKDGQR